MADLTKKFKKLSPVMKIVVVVVIAIILLYVFKRAKGYLSQMSKKAKQVGKKDALEAQGISLTYPKSKYKDYADELYNAMAGAGTDFKTIANVFNKMVNELDVIELDQAFGFRDTFWTAPANLKDWLRGDLSESEMKQINELLAGKGIEKRF